LPASAIIKLIEKILDTVRISKWAPRSYEGLKIGWREGKRGGSRVIGNAQKKDRYVIKCPELNLI
jgi:hypothetical protein